MKENNINFTSQKDIESYNHEKNIQEQINLLHNNENLVTKSLYNNEYSDDFFVYLSTGVLNNYSQKSLTSYTSSNEMVFPSEVSSKIFGQIEKESPVLKLCKKEYITKTTSLSVNIDPNEYNCT
jgi:hypothetical protein